MVPMPMNTAAFFRHFTPLARFEWFNSLDTSSYLIYYNMEPHKGKNNEFRSDVVHQLSQMGYQDHSTLHNLSVFRFFFFLGLAKLILYPFVVSMQKRRPKSLFWRRLRNQFKDSLFYQDLLLVALYGFLEIIITGYIAAKNPVVESGA
jgi:hypothetical protein